MAETLGSRLRQARVAADKTQDEVAKHLEVTRQAVTGWEAGAAEPSKKNLPKVAAYLGTTVAALTGSDDAAFQQVVRGPSEIGRVIENPPLHGLAEKDVPVLGVAVGGEDADFYWNGEIVDRARRPPSLANAKGVYALYIAGFSMAPKYEEGEMVYVNPGRPAQIGDYVIVELHPDEGERAGPGYIKRLVKRTSTTIITEQFNPAKEIVFDLARVRSVHRIMPWTELLGI